MKVFSATFCPENALMLLQGLQRYISLSGDLEDEHGTRDIAALGPAGPGQDFQSSRFFWKR